MYPAAKLSIATIAPLAYDRAMVEVQAVIQNEHGIHCRPSAVILNAIGDYLGVIEIRCAGGCCNARSMLGLLSLGLSCGTAITLRVTGPDEKAMAQKLKELFETHFDYR